MAAGIWALAHLPCKSPRFSTPHCFSCARSCHVILANLRPAGSKGYVIPRGFLFNFISCPNYPGGWLAAVAAAWAGGCCWGGGLRLASLGLDSCGWPILRWKAVLQLA